MKRGWIVVLLAAGFLAGAILLAPATFFGRMVQTATGGRVLIGNAVGSFWSGGGNVAFQQQDGQTQNKETLALGHVQWRVEFSRLLSGKVALHISQHLNTSAGEIVFSPDMLEINQLNVELPAALIGMGVPLLRPAQLEGQLKISSEKLLFSGGILRGAALLRWGNAASALSAVRPLGNYNFVLKDDGTGMRIDVATLSGDLLLEGKGSWLMGQGVTFQGSARAAEGKQEVLSELLTHIGPQRKPGIYSISLSGMAP